MKVYTVNAFAKPPRSKFEHYAGLNCRKSDDAFLDLDRFAGSPFPKKWRRVNLFFDDPLSPRADFYHFGAGVFVCTEQARHLTGAALNAAGEFLPVSIEGEADTHYIYNVTNGSDFLDPAKTIWEFYEPRQLRVGIAALAFKPNLLNDQNVFKIRENGGSVIYCVERTGDHKNGEFKALVSKHKLGGLEFQLVWSDKHGPVRPNHGPVTPGLVWRTGEGKSAK